MLSAAQSQPSIAGADNLISQASGQGPYFGQAAHFKMFAPEKIPYGIKRYADEVKRVMGVLESVLADGREWLIAGKCTIADLSFITWCVAPLPSLLLLSLTFVAFVGTTSPSTLSFPKASTRRRSSLTSFSGTTASSPFLTLPRPSRSARDSWLVTRGLKGSRDTCANTKSVYTFIWCCP